MRSVACRVLIASLLMAAVLAWALSPPPPPKRSPPIGWEERTTPGFDPPIEYSIAYAPLRFSGGLSDEQKAIAAKWGPGAGEVLVKLYDAPGWEAYRNDILDWLDCVEFPAKAEFYVAKIKELLADPEFNNPRDTTKKNFAHNLMHRLQRIDAQAADALVEEGLRDPQSPDYGYFVTHPMTFLGATRDDRYEIRLREIAKSTSDEQLRRNIEETLKYHEAYKRAQEPMERVLSREREKGAAR